jgi:hypothetical protein
MAEFVGVEDLGIEGSGRFGINITGGYGCWVKNVHVRNVEYAHVSMTDSLFCEIRQCVISMRVGDNGAGIQLGTSSFCRIEDNVFTEAQIELSAASGNVVAYNLFRDFELYGVLGPSISSRQHSGYNLYEGNVAGKFQADGPGEMVFRNRLHGTSTSTAKSWICVNLSRSMRNASIVGNVLGAPGHPWVYDNSQKGNLIYSFGDVDARATALVKGNFNWKDARVPEAEAVDALPKSLYLTSKPAWWGDAAWPPFGPDVSFEKNKIPAETR